MGAVKFRKSGGVEDIIKTLKMGAVKNLSKNRERSTAHMYVPTYRQCDIE